MNKDQLEKLSKNPYHKLAPSQQAELDSSQKESKPVRNRTKLDKHDTAVQKHPTEADHE
jgi:hypothetical protein